MMAQKVIQSFRIGWAPAKSRACSVGWWSRCQHLHTTASQQFLDARGKDHEEKEKQLIVSKGQVFDDAAKRERSKRTFEEAIMKYKSRHDKYMRGHVEFIYAALQRMKEFGVEKDLGMYKHILNLMPKEKMIAQTTWQVEMMHFPKQQQCAIDVLDQMESHGVIPDDAMGYQLKEIFGVKAHAFRKYQRMMYWLPKFKNANPYPVPYTLPEDPRELARIALKRMAVDLENMISDFETSELKDAQDDTFVVSAQSPSQQCLLANHDVRKPVFVEGGFEVWLRNKCLTFFILKSEATQTFRVHRELQEQGYDEEAYFKDFLKDIPFFTDKKETTSVVKVPCVHEQEDGTILAMCITGSATKDSLISWVKWLQDTNPKLGSIPVVFSLRTPESGLVQQEEKQNQEDLAAL